MNGAHKTVLILVGGSLNRCAFTFKTFQTSLFYFPLNLLFPSLQPLYHREQTLGHGCLSYLLVVESEGW